MAELALMIFQIEAIQTHFFKS